MGPMQRRHLFELNDEPWAPAPLRDAIIETLSLALRLGGAMRGVVEPLSGFVAASGADEILDLCAGAGGPAQVLAHELGARLGAAAPRIVLTDLYPRVEAWSAVRDGARGLVDFVPEPVDATHIPAAVARSRGGDGPPRARIVLNAFSTTSSRASRALDPRRRRALGRGHLRARAVRAQPPAVSLLRARAASPRSPCTRS
jgi:hypothetical protein